ncbi:MAG TPA: response regulator [Verrucomicrobiae bacterium]|nr:response regulator [Verrucomicrobiae bacterium]
MKLKLNLVSGNRWKPLPTTSAVRTLAGAGGTTTTSTHAQPGTRRILVVDDDAVVRKTTEMKLRAEGYDVITAEDGPSALAATRIQRPDLILLDLEFPPDPTMTWDGFRLMEWLQRAEPRPIPVILFTGCQDKDLSERAALAGATGFFQKPLLFGPLFALIQWQLNGKSSGREQSSPGAA